jgi:hypothetical protein
MNIPGSLGGGGVEYGLMKAGLVQPLCYTKAGRLTKPDPLPMNILGRLGGVECGLMKAGLVYSWCSYYTMLLLADRLTKANPSPMNIQGRLGGVEYGLTKAGLVYSWCSHYTTRGRQTD